MGESRDDDNVRDMGKARPFQQSANRYLSAGWWPITVEYGLKHPPRTGYTGRNCQWPDEDSISEWSEEKNWNVAFHLGPVPPPSERGLPDEDPEWSSQEWVDEVGNPMWTVVGIDVDDYEDGEKVKEGHAQLMELMSELGDLPETWTSSSRDDGKSGIRYFLAPAEYGYKGKIASHIDVIQQAHRYAMVWPSLHPSGGQYTWFGPGQAPQGQGAQGYAAQPARRYKSGGVSQLRFVQQEVVPLVWTLPLLPEPWVERLTEGYMRHEGHSIDMDSSVDEVWEWAEKHFNQDPEGEYCQRMRKRVEAWKHDILEDATSHDKIRDAHWNILCNGSEGHPGWIKALKEIEAFWLEDVVKKRGKRALGEANGEMFRSRTNALRKIKAAVKEGSRGLNVHCPCYTPPPLDGGGEFRPTGKPRNPGEYTQDDDGNGEHFVDVFGGSEGDLRFIEEMDQWLMWLGDRWEAKDEKIIRRAFRETVKERQINFAEHLHAVATDMEALEDPNAKAARNLANKWAEWARRSGNVSQAKNALDAAKTYDGITIEYADVDSREDLLAVANGVLQLNARSWDSSGNEVMPEQSVVFHEKPDKNDLLVQNTGVPYIPLQEQYKAGGDLAAGARAWADFLGMFLPEKPVRDWAQQVFGHMLYGKNIAKQLVFLYGPSDTGKTTFLNTITAALGEYAGTFNMAMFKQGKEFNPQLLESLKRRMIGTSEVGGTSEISAEVMKQISGNDPMMSEVKNSMKNAGGVPAFVTVFATNSPPEVHGNDPALQGRIVVIPFRHQAQKSSKGNAIPEICAAAALAWMVEGWDLYVKNDMKNKPVTEDIAESESTFRQGMMGDAAMFVEECCDLTQDADDLTAQDQLFSVYKSWATESGFEKTWNKIVFGKKLKEAGVMEAISTRKAPGREGEVVKARPGIKLKPEWSVPRRHSVKFKVSTN